MTLGHELRNSITTHKVKPDAQGKHNPAQKVEKEKAYIESNICCAVSLLPQKCKRLHLPSKVGNLTTL